jgi:hypothetical protein
MPQYTTMGLMGEVNTTDGKWLIDAREVKEFAYSVGSGTLPSVGDTITDSGSASGKVIRLNSGTATSGVMTVTEQSGTFTATNTLSSGTFSATLDSVAVGLLEYLGEESQNNVATGLGTIDFKGEWYELGVGDGTDNQTFTLPYTGLATTLWVETGNGTDVFEMWMRIGDADAFTNYQTGDLGKVFKQTIDTTSVTFGTSTQGEAPSLGARIRMPNLVIGTATLLSPLIQMPAATTNANTMFEIDQNSSAIFICDKTCFSTMRSQVVGFDTVTMTDCSMAINNVSCMDGIVQGFSMSRCGFGAYNEMFDTRTYQVDDNPSGLYDHCKWVTPDNFGTGIQIATSSNIDILDCHTMSSDKDQSQGSKRITMNNCSSFNVERLAVIGPELYLQQGSSDITIKDIRFSANTDGVLRTTGASDIVGLTQGCNGCTIDGVSVIPGGAPPRDDLFNIADSVNITVRNIGSITNKLDMQNHCDMVAVIGGASSGTRLQRIWIDNQGDNVVFAPSNTATNTLIENCSGRYNSQSLMDGSNSLAKGLHLASGAINTINGMRIDYPLAVGNIFQDVFTSDTTGRLHAIFQPAGLNESFVNLVGGGAAYRKDGDLYLRENGDYVEIESPYDIKGHTGFQNADFVISGEQTSGITVEYAIDTGTGFGAYKEATGANLSAETISPTGFRFKWKLTSTSDDINRLVNGIYVSTTTTLTDQENNFYPIVSDDIIVEDGTIYTEDAVGKFIVNTDTVTSFTISGVIPNKIETIGTGTSTIIGTNNAKLVGTIITENVTDQLIKGDGLNPSTNWVESGTTDKVVTLTASTTETDLLGLRGLEFVDYIETGDFKTYVFAEDVRLVIEGDLQIDPAKEKIVLSATGKNSTGLVPLRVASGGILRVGLFQNVNGIDVYSQGSSIEFIGSSTDFFSYFMMYVATGGSFIWNGGTIRTFGTLRIENGSTLTINSGTLLNLSSVDVVQLRLTPTDVTGGSNMNINNMIFDGLVFQSRFFTTYGFNNAVFTFKKGEFQTYNGSYPEQTLINLDNSQNTNTSDIFSSHGQQSNTEDVYIQNAYKEVSFGSQSGRNLYAHVLRQIDITPEDLNGVSLSEFSYYGTDINNGLRQVGPMNATDSSQDDTADKVYSGVNQSTTINDNILLMLAILIEGGTGDIVLDDRTNNETIPLNVIAYDRSITTWNTKLYGLGTLTESLSMTPDLSITETNRATVDAYTELETPEKLYDYAKSYLCSNYQGEAATIVSRSGDVIDLGNYDLDIDATAAQPFDLTGNKITIKSSVFTGNLLTSGTITFLNGASIDGSYTDVNGTITIVSVNVTVNDTTASPIEGAQCLIAKQGTDSIIGITRSGSTVSVNSTTHGYSIGDKVLIRGANEFDYNGIQTITNVVDVDNFEYTIAETPTTPATGTLTRQTIYLDDSTNASGQISTIANYVSDTPVTCVIRKATSAPYYKAFKQNATLTSNGIEIQAVMINDS